jgi:hypothetical protein
LSTSEKSICPSVLLQQKSPPPREMCGLTWGSCASVSIKDGSYTGSIRG